MTSRSRVLVLGSGGIGSLVAARLAMDPDVDVTLAVRRPTSSLTLVEGDNEFVAPVHIVTGPAGLERYDWVVVATKVYDVPGLRSWFESEVCDGARYLVAQNGVEHAERLAPWVPAGRVLPAIVTYGAERVTPGRVVQTLAGSVRLPSNALADEFAAVSAAGSLQVDVVAEFATALWTKLALNLASNSLTTIADVPVREVALRPGLRDVATSLVTECCAVARATGVELEESVVDEMVTRFAEYPPTLHSSMWQDRHSGRLFEHDAISGALTRIGRARGIDTPCAALITSLLDGIEMGC
ncbi:ketopantoate reductase family protein [Nocardioides alcanivorans]|uniref:ketopantoate reductase family protein n=1 Tax=Nocardioides alcanivorans TaxID=2897352 RepID=UPI001F1DF141|nr:2-dehydropantoate 2-reductase [Nocardioides alcanivorans]